MKRTISIFAMVAATLFGQQTPQLEIIPYKDSTPGTLRFYENRSNARNYVGFRASDSIASDCTYRISDVVFTPCASDQVVLGASGLRFSNFFGRGIDLTSSSTPTTAQLYVRRFSNAGIISAVDNGAAEMEFTISNNGNEKFFVGESISRVGVPMETGQIRPLVTSTSSLGTNTRRWTNFFTDNAVITTGFRVGTSSTSGWVMTTDASGNGTWQPAAGGTALPVVDTQPITKNAVDNTKLMRFSNALQTTGTTRVLTNPDADITLAGINLAQTWTASQDFQQIQPSATSTYSNGTNTRRWTNMFTDNINITSGIRITTSATFGNVLTTDVSGNGSWQPLPVAAFATAGIVSGGTQSFSGDKTFLGTTSTQSLNITGTTTHTGSIQFDVDALRNIGSSVVRANQVWMSQSRATAYYYNGTLGLTVNVTAGGCTLSFIAGGMTAFAGVC
jgi:hypothetical protein